jgi:hypothetical protein
VKQKLIAAKANCRKTFSQFAAVEGSENYQFQA